MTSGCLDRKEVRGAIWGVHSTTDRPAGEDTGRLFLAFGGPVCADRISNCPLDRVLTYKNLIYLLYPQTKVGDILDSGPSRRRRRRRRRRNFLVDAITQKQINIFFSNLVHMLRVPKGRSLF